MSIFFELLFIHNISSKHDRETKASLLRKRRRRGEFRVPPGLCVKTRVGAQPLILMQIKLISTRKVVHLASF